mgnify:CR=1 FL=1
MPADESSAPARSTFPKLLLAAVASLAALLGPLLMLWWHPLAAMIAGAVAALLYNMLRQAKGPLWLELFDAVVLLTNVAVFLKACVTLMRMWF